MRKRLTFKGKEEGQVIVMVAIMAIVLAAIIGLAVDVGRLYATKAQLSRAVDAAALSGILEFNGTTAGLTAAQNKAVEYFNLNEPGNLATVTAYANPNANELSVDAAKTVNMTFLSLLNLGPVTVRAHAKAGFGTQYLDTVMVLDATQSMVGNPITQAKAAANTFKNILLGANPQGNVKIGVTAFRGCFKNTPITYSECVDRTSWVRGLTENAGNLATTISNISGGGGTTGTNVCTGLAMGWDILDGPGNHKNSFLYPTNHQYLILLSDGDNYYAGENTYQGPLGATSTSSPTGTTIGGNAYSCQPIDSSSGSTGSSCPSPWNTSGITSTYPCYKGVYQAGASENWDSNSFSSGTGWLAGSWTKSPTSTSQLVTSNTAPQAGSYHLKMIGGTAATNVSEDWESNSFTGGSGWLASGWTTSPSSSSAVSVANTAAQGGSRHLKLTGASASTITEDWELNTYTGGSGWSAGWVRSSTSQIAISTTAPVQGGSRHLRFVGTGSSSTTVTATREIDLSNITDATLSYYVRKNSSFGGSGSSDRVRVRVSGDNSSWTTLLTHDQSNNTLTTSYANYTVDLSAFVGDSSVYVQFETRTNSSTDEAYVDTISITRSISAVSATRTVDLSGLTDATLSYYIRRNSSFSSPDLVRVQASGDGNTWTTLRTHSSLTTSYVNFTSDLSAFLGDSSVYIRFEGAMNAPTDEAYVDTITIARTSSSGTVSLTRTIDLSSVTDASLKYYIRRNSSYTTGDEVRVQASGDGTTWTTLRTHRTSDSNITTSYVSYTSDLAAFLGDNSVYIRFESAIVGSTHEAYVDTITVDFTSGSTSNSDGYLNGNDNSNPATCNETPRPRERQLDSRTLKLAQAMKAYGVEIFVVAFTTDTIPGCNLGNTTVYNDEVASQCNAVDQTTAPNPLASSGPAGNGPIGDNTAEGTSNHRLLKCIASNSQDSLDHYYYASSANELTIIFTTIANQIAHRLIE